MAEKKKKEKKQKDKTQIVLPKAWQSVKHRNETAQAKTNYEDMWKAIGVVLIIGVIAFVLLGGVSQTGTLKAIAKWSNNVGNWVGNWINAGEVITNEDGIYIKPGVPNSSEQILDPNDTTGLIDDVGNALDNAGTEEDSSDENNNDNSEQETSE